MISLERYVIISKTNRSKWISTYGVELKQKEPKGLSANQIAIQLNIKIPERFFERPMPVIKLELPSEGIYAPEIATSVAVTAHTVAGALNIDATKVEDALSQLVAESNKEDIDNESNATTTQA